MKLSAVAEPNRSSEPTFARINNPERRIPRRTSGCCTVCSTNMNSATSTAATLSAPSVRTDVQPVDGASTIAHTKTRNAPVTVSAPAAEHVGAPSPEEEESAVAEDERGDDPLQLAIGQVQRRADRRQRDLDEREVERVEEDDPAEDGAGPPSAGLRVHPRAESSVA